MAGEFTERDRLMLSEMHDAMIRFAEFRSSHEKSHEVIEKRLDAHSEGIRQLSVKWYGIAASLVTALGALVYLFYEVIHGSR